MTFDVSYRCGDGDARGLGRGTVKPVPNMDEGVRLNFATYALVHRAPMYGTPRTASRASKPPSPYTAELT
jgi:hypothetical protein